VVAAAAAFRFYALDIIPPGFHHDEAFEAVEALKILRGDGMPIFFSGNYGVEPMFIYLTAMAFAIFEPGPVVMRAVAALVGTLTIPALYWLARELIQDALAFQNNSKTGWNSFALLAAAVLAVLYWHIHFSRIGIEPVLVPLDATLLLWALWRGRRTQGQWPFVLAGVCLGLGPYTYPAGRLLPFLVAAIIAYLTLVDRPFIKRCWRQLLLLVLVAAIVVAPLGFYFARHPALLFLRTSQVAVTNETAAGGPLQNLVRTMLMFSVPGHGDVDPRNNLPGRPALDPVLSLLFYLGLGVALWHWRRPAWGMLVLWLGAMLIPTVFSEWAPHFRRALGATAPTALLIALGGWSLWQAADWAAKKTRLLPHRAIPAATQALIFLALVSSATLAARDYFERWGRDPALFYAFDEGLLNLGRRIRQLAAIQVYISPTWSEHPTLAFALWGERLKSFDGRACLVLPPESDRPSTYFIIVHEDKKSLQRLAQITPGGQTVEVIRDSYGKKYAVIYQVPSGTPRLLQPPRPAGFILGNAELLGYAAPTTSLRPGEALNVTLYWRVLAPFSADYTVSVQLLGPYNPATGSSLWAQHDTQPGQGSYPTSRWTAGEIILDDYLLLLPANMPSGRYQLAVTMYLLETRQRLPVFDKKGSFLGDYIILGEVLVF